MRLARVASISAEIALCLLTFVRPTYPNKGNVHNMMLESPLLENVTAVQFFFLSGR